MAKTFADYGITNVSGTGEVKTICPRCSPNRKKKHVKCLNVNMTTGVWHCWHCEWAGGLKDGTFNQPKIKKIYTKPTQSIGKLSAWWVDWLRGRGIGTSTIKENSIFDTDVYMPQIEAFSNAICFPAIYNDEVINIKYRDKLKNFRMHAGARRILYGLNHVESDKPLIWVEGEMDKLSLYEAGYKNCVSVPDGAPSVNTKNYETKFDYLELDETVKLLEGVSEHIIAVDNDEPGIRLQQELINRLGYDKCKIVKWVDNCKDANEVLTKKGKITLANCIKSAKHCPVKGCFTASDFLDDYVRLYENGEVGGLPVGYEYFDELFSVRPGDFTVVTGIPSHGKSEFLDSCIVKLALNHGMKTSICSPENQPPHLHMKKITEKWVGKSFFDTAYGNRMSEEEAILAALEWGEYIYFIAPPEPTIGSILECAKSDVLRYGIDILIIDPWNEIEHSRPSKQSESEYIGDALRQMRIFARNHNVHLFIVAHPTKITTAKNDGSVRVPTPYDISGSANWRNKADNCLAVFRGSDYVDVYVQKIRVKEVGRTGRCRFQYINNCGRYAPFPSDQQPGAMT